MSAKKSRGSARFHGRAIVELSGPAELLPWTNRKDRLDASAPTYQFLYTELTSAYRAFLRDSVRPHKLRLRREVGIHDPDILDVLRESYASKINGRQLNPNAVRQKIRESKAFMSARQPALSVPPPPSPSREAKTLAGEVEIEKIKKAKAILRAATDQTDVSDTQLVRTMLNHFLTCKLATGNVDGSDSSEEQA